MKPSQLPASLSPGSPWPGEVADRGADVEPPGARIPAEPLDPTLRQIAPVDDRRFATAGLGRSQMRHHEVGVGAILGKA